ncbi:MAG TPA: VIT domain-containing protein [Vicinamibacteria bacterium]|nr:VIT domain-containing protein [Vicinamibacteria bacterium]
MTREDAVGAAQGPGGLQMAKLLGRLLAMAVIVGIAMGLLLTAAAVAWPATAAAQDMGPDRATSGRFLMRRSGEEPWVMAPTLATEVSFRVAGVVARASVRQRFRNGTDGWVEGVYVFPLPETAAVDHLLMRVGERTIEGQIREREQAKAEYRQARDEGRKASLVEQERPNIFTTSVANLDSGEELDLRARDALPAGRPSGTRRGPPPRRTARRPGGGSRGFTRTGEPRWPVRWKPPSWGATTRSSCARSCS